MTSWCAAELNPRPGRHFWKRQLAASQCFGELPVRYIVSACFLHCLGLGTAKLVTVALACSLFGGWGGATHPVSILGLSLYQLNLAWWASSLLTLSWSCSLSMGTV